jgi:triosephosphate isomerase
MHKNIAQTKAYMSDLCEMVRQYPKFQYFVVPPYTSIVTAKEIGQPYGVMVGAQNAHWLDEGAYTGEISVPMLREIGVDLIEIGHSERRQYGNETDYSVNKKTLKALESGLIALICVGENNQEKEHGATSEVIRRQIKIALSGVSAMHIDRIWIAYEPVWSIGENGVPAEPSYAQNVHGVIRDCLTQLFGENAVSIPLLYGGSVNADNAAQLIICDNIDGLFIGRSAWDMEQFNIISQRVRAAAENQKVAANG